ncbi:aromatic acid exporter family protein [Bacillus timonensis]|nr:aromatic acid exporter family protein [Bacillus timonensis]
MFKIGYRTAKTAIGTGIAIYIAQMLGLDNYASAGIITILCVQVTKKKSLRSSWERLFACIIGIIFSFVFFEGLGYNPVSLSLLLLLFIPTIVAVKAKQGIVTSTVIILHIFAVENFTFALVLNELALIIIGIGIALLVNLYMPSVEKELKQYQHKIEENIGKIFMEMVTYLRTNESQWEGKEITETEELILKAKTVAFRDVENHFLRYENEYYHYFKMREKQFEIIERMLPIVTSIRNSCEQGEIVANYIEEISKSIHPGNTVKRFLVRLDEMRKQFQNMPLPKSRAEFEARAELFHFLKEMEQYLIIKRSFKGIS